MTLPLLLAAVVGFNHAFEADHVLAVGNIANQRNNLLKAVRDGMFWGLGHTSTIFAVGCLIILGRSALEDVNFELFEAIVGATLIVLGTYRLMKVKGGKRAYTGGVAHDHKLAYSVGLIHGLAGSGTVILLAMTQLEYTYQSLLYLVIFGFGSILGMMVVAGVFNLPFSKRIRVGNTFQFVLLILSAVLCMGYGGWIVYGYFS
ncbi:MAG: urease accessory protein [Bacteroidota bacterium]